MFLFHSCHLGLFFCTSQFRLVWPQGIQPNGGYVNVLNDIHL